MGDTKRSKEEIDLRERKKKKGKGKEWQQFQDYLQQFININLCIIIAKGIPFHLGEQQL